MIFDSHTETRSRPFLSNKEDVVYLKFTYLEMIGFIGTYIIMKLLKVGQ